MTLTLKTDQRRRARGWRAATASLAFLAVSGCAVAADVARTAPPQQCRVTAAQVVPAAGALLGVNLDWGTTTVEEYSERLGRAPAVAVTFADFPLSAAGSQNLRGAADQLRPSGGVLLLTLEPVGGLQTVSRTSAKVLADQLSSVNDTGVPVVVRFAHEMNGSWYPWSQRPQAYIEAFRTLAAAIHDAAPGTGMMWAPNYGGGYPFTGGRFEAKPDGTGFASLDTNHDGVLTEADDPYAPYYPGDDAVDWVGMSLYHWGSAHPWGENEVPEPGKFAAQLTGEYDGLGGDDSAVPDFYETYAVGHEKPLAIPETAALFIHRDGGSRDIEVKRTWWRQVLSEQTLDRFPRLHMVNWFEWNKQENEVSLKVDWRVTSTIGLREAFSADLPAGVLSAEALPDWCRPN